ncbi:GNAT family N-acetyltransferase [Fusobacterium sp. PH5-44]|uniref:GNAT family N-acetyltransferase n=1 Tax=unclassified Fusobacterium TaxID=2648384 RepID=UPI003D1D37E5
MIKIVKELRLTEKQKQQMNELEKVCQIEDNYRNIMVSSELNFTQELHAFYLAYDEEQLIGVLNLFAPQNNEVELMGYVNPSWQLKGVFKQLICEMIKELKNFSTVEKILFVYDEKSDLAKKVIEKWEMEHDFSEYTMVLHKKVQEFIVNNLLIKPLAQEDVESTLKLSVEAFGGDLENAKHYIEISMNAPNKVIYGAFLHNIQIGMAVLTEEKHTTFLSGFVISESYRGKGYGKEMLLQLLNKIDSSCTLEVNSDNCTAFHLYKKLGFIVLSQTNYAKTNIQQIVNI